MTKTTPDAQVLVGEQQLAAWGIAGDAPPDALAAVIGRASAADLAIAQRLGRRIDEASAQLLQCLERDAVDKAGRKAARRALYRLAQHGVCPPDTPAAVASAPALGVAIEGLLSSLDGRGDQLVWLLRPQPGGVAHLFGVVNDPDGLREVALHTVSRKALKSLRAELEQRHELRLVPVDWRHADFLLRRAFEWALARGTRMDGDYPALRAQFARTAAPSTSPLAVPATTAAALIAAAELLGEPELRTWFRPAEDLAPYLEELAAVKDSPLVLNETQQQERFEEIIGRCIDGLFGEARRTVWVRRLGEMAHYFTAARRPARAAQAQAVAAALAADTAPREVAFCAQLVRASLAYFFQVAAEQERERERTSLIVTPQQATRPRDRA